MSENARELRNALGRFLTGVTVVTTVDSAGVPKGFTANSFSSVSLEPPLISVCVAETSSSYDAFLSRSRFCVNVLSARQKHVALQFASRGGDKFKDIGWRSGLGDVPVLEEALATFECTSFKIVQAGDHAVLIGRVENFAYENGKPMGYFAGSFVDFEDERRAVEANTRHDATTVGGLFATANEILLLRRGELLWVPTASTLGEETRGEGSLLGLLSGLGVEVSVGFVFSVSNDPRTDALNVYYRGDVVHVDENASSEICLIPFDQIEWERVRSSKYRMMLQRFISEIRQNRYGVFFGNTDAGSVISLARDGT